MQARGVVTRRVMAGGKARERPNASLPSPILRYAFLDFSTGFFNFADARSDACCSVPHLVLAEFPPWSNPFVPLYFTVVSVAIVFTSFVGSRRNRGVHLLPSA